MGTDNTSSRKARIEGLWALGRSTHQIAQETGVGLEYIQYIVRLIQAHSRMRDVASNDDAKHLRLISRTPAKRFPSFDLPARSRMRA